MRYNKRETLRYFNSHVFVKHDNTIINTFENVIVVIELHIYTRTKTSETISYTIIIMNIKQTHHVVYYFNDECSKRLIIIVLQ